jgi:hypothetical protein
MRSTEKLVAILILMLAAWAILMSLATSFQGSQSNRILLVELGSDAASLNLAVQAGGKTDTEGIGHNIRIVVRNTYMDFVFIVLYWLTFVGLSYLAALLGQRVLAICATLCISFAALADVLENHAILIAMGVSPFTDPVAVDISEYSQFKWACFFLATVLLGLAIALNSHTSRMRRVAGGIFVASGVFGILGIARYRVSLDFAMVMINIGILLLAVALLLTVWKLFQSLKELNHNGHTHHAHVHA